MEEELVPYQLSLILRCLSARITVRQHNRGRRESSPDTAHMISGRELGP